MQSEKVNYSALAGFLSSLPEEIAIRRFRELHVQSLLFYQAELVQLQRELRELEDIDSKLHIEVKDSELQVASPATFHPGSSRQRFGGIIECWRAPGSRRRRRRLAAQ
jgi:hypothetical protein